MTHRVLRTAAALCGGATLLLSVGAPPAGATASLSADGSSHVTPAPPSQPGGALPVQPVGGGGCVIGLNCGCIRNVTCPGSRPHPHPGNVNNQPHPAPGSGNP
ncbi:hypothetical protein [Mycobacterium sp. 050134]|uniref:hypothetical protein n=1 Tax=Mycobacterium sp. 050134 TaxID=3096111 RepID=UPI002ED928F8